MPTIKTTGTGSGLRVITKTIDGQMRVSCECCDDEPICCIFPVHPDGGWPLPLFFEWEDYEEFPVPHFSDWPSQLRVNWPGHLEGNIDKSATLFEYQTGNIRIRRNDDKSAWILEDLTDSENIVTRTIGWCLIRGDGGLTLGDNLVEDLWFDQYITNPITNYFGETYIVTFTRISLCEWVSSGHPPECDPWTLHAFTLHDDFAGFTLEINDWDPYNEFCVAQSKMYACFDPDNAVFGGFSTFDTTLNLTPL